MKSLIVFSGGMDSTALLYSMIDAGDDVLALTFNYGSKHNDMEYKHAKITTDKLNIEHIRLDLPLDKYLKSDLLKSGGEIPKGHYEDETMKSTVVPFRNGIMLSIAAGIAESYDCDSIYIGNHFGDHAIYPDCRTRFIEPMTEAIREGTYKNISLKSPYSDITKTDIAIIGDKLNVPWIDTYSCYEGGPIHCGECGTCNERKEAFRDSKITDPTEYLI